MNVDAVVFVLCGTVCRVYVLKRALDEEKAEPKWTPHSSRNGVGGGVSTAALVSARTFCITRFGGWIFPV